MERWWDGLKLIGTANATELISSGAALNYFATKTHVIWYIKAAGILFCIVTILFIFCMISALLHFSLHEGWSYNRLLSSLRDASDEEQTEAASKAKRKSIRQRIITESIAFIEIMCLLGGLMTVLWALVKL